MNRNQLSTPVFLGLLLCLGCFSIGLTLWPVEWQRQAQPEPGSPAGAADRSLPQSGEAKALAPSSVGQRGELLVAPIAAANFPGVRLAGRCEDQAGEPIAGARILVKLYFLAWGDAGPLETLSAADGSFEVAGLVPGRAYVVYAFAGGYLSKSESFQPAQEALMVLEEELYLEGRVQDAKSGLALGGVQLHIEDPRWHFDPAGLPVPVLSAEDGSFHLPGLRSSYGVNVQASRLGYITKSQRFDARSEEGPMLLELEPGQLEDFVVLDWETGKAIQGARIGARRPTQGKDGPTDATGVFSWPMDAPGRPEQHQLVSVWAEGYCTTLANLNHARSLGAARQVYLVRGLELTGQVLGPGGQALEAAYVRLNYRVPEAAEQIGLPAWQQLKNGGSRSWAVLSEAGGQYRFSGLMPGSGSATLSSQHSKFRLAEDLRFELAGAANFAAPSLVLSLGAALEGRVTVDGQGARIRLGWSRAGKQAQALWTASDGSYRLEGLEPGAWRLSYPRKYETRGDRDPALDTGIEVQGGENRILKLDLFERVSARLQGRVRYADGALPNEKSSLVSAWAYAGKNRYSLPLDAQGRFDLQLPTLDGVPWTLSAKNEQSRVQLASIQLPASEQDLVLPDLGRVGVRFLDSVSRTPVELESLSWRPGRKALKKTRERARILETDADGVHWIELPTGTVTLWGSTGHPLFFFGEQLELEVTHAGPQRVDLTVEKGIQLKLRMVSDDGLPSTPFSVAPRQLLNGHGERQLLDQSRAQDGTSSYYPLRPGTYGLKGHPFIGYSLSTVEVKHGGMPVIDLHWHVTDQAAYGSYMADAARQQEMFRDIEPCFDY